jgi:hypothetical protein
VNWKLIFILSLFGMGMALATVSLVPENWDVVFWVPIFIACAVFIARNTKGKYFLHGLLVCLLNCAWITAAHIYYADTYLAHHAGEKASYLSVNNALHANLSITQAMLVMGPFIGIISGLVLGLFAFIAARLVKKHEVAA